jgi:hypothetical protein
VARLEITEEPSSADRPNRLTGSAAFRLHLTLASGLVLCVGAFCLETIRALGGNTLSWVYVFEWPFFAGFGIYMWWKLLNGWDRDLPSSHGGANPSGGEAAGGGAPGGGQEQDEALRAWNRYLREMRDAEDQDQGPAT